MVGLGTRRASEFTHDGRPDLAPPFIRACRSVSSGARRRPRGCASSRTPPVTRRHDLPDGLRRALEEAVVPDAVSADPLGPCCPRARQVAARSHPPAGAGSSSPGSPTWWCGRLQSTRSPAPSCGRRSSASRWCSSPLAGSSSISRSLKAPTGEVRPVISVDLARLDRLLRRSTRPPGWPGSRPGSRAQTRRRSWPLAATRSATSPTRSHTRRSAAGSPPAPRGCSPIATATSPT